VSPSRSQRESAVQLEADPSCEQRDDELVERHALLGGAGDELLVEGRGASDEDLPVGCHAANNIACAIDIASSACDITPMTYTDTYGADEQGEFERIPVTELQGGDIIPSHDGRYHLYEGHAVHENGMVEVCFRRARGLGGEGGETYYVEFTPDHEIAVLM
jgi:hypothetical protein